VNAAAETVESLRAQLEDMKRHARTWERRAKENRDEADALRRRFDELERVGLYTPGRGRRQ
jgi:DNA repair ATPase RecN